MVQDFEYPILEPFGPNCAVVDQIGFVDLRQAFETGVMPADIIGSEDNYNGIDVPESIVGRPDDIFAAHRAMSAISSNSASSDVSPDRGESA